MNLKSVLKSILARLLPPQPLPPQKLKIDHRLFSHYVQKILEPDSIYMEIGAATGLSSRERISEWGLSPENAYLVEGCPINCEVISREIPESNALNYVVTDTVGEIEFYVVNDVGEPGSSRSNSFDRKSIQRKRPGQDIQEIVVSSITMDHLFDTLEIDRCDFLFFNCEGAEYSIFTGECRFLKKVRLMSLDLHKGLYGDAKTKGEMIDRKLEIYQLLEDNGFTRIGGHNREDLYQLSDYHLTSFWENGNL